MKTWFVVLAALAACQQNEKAAPAKNAPAPAPKPAAVKAPGGNATAALTLTGAIEKTLSGRIAFCAIPMIGGNASGATYQIVDGDLQMAILATTERELRAPKIVLNVAGANRASYTARETGTNALLYPGKSAEIEADLDRIGPKETVHVKGTVTCD